MPRASRLPLLSLLSFTIILCSSLVCVAQNREKFVISAKAGGINAITGQADVHGRGESDWQRLSITDDLDAGDRVRTAYDARVEILLNPGSYLRLGGNSEVELSDNTLANIEVRLLRGTAIVEAAGADGIDLNISISTPHTKLSIVRQGLYRLNVVPEGATELIVRKGRVILSDSQKVKGGNKVVFNATNVSVAKLTKEEKKLQEDVDLWSKERGKTLAKANSRINNSMMMAALNSFRDRAFPSGHLGLWFYNARANCYTFLPYYYGLNSPYGSYSTYFYGGSSLSGYGWYYRPNVNGSGQTGQAGGSGNASRGGGGYGNNGNARPTPPSGGFGNPSAGMSRRPIDSETGRQMPRKNMERLPNQ